MFSTLLNVSFEVMNVIQLCKRNQGISKAHLIHDLNANLDTLILAQKTDESEVHLRHLLKDKKQSPSHQVLDLSHPAIWKTFTQWII